MKTNKTFIISIATLGVGLGIISSSLSNILPFPNVLFFLIGIGLIYGLIVALLIGIIGLLEKIKEMNKSKE